MDEITEMIKAEIRQTAIENNESKIIALLSSTNREGMDKLIEHMDKQGFFTSPCSTQYHLAKNGGLAEHSLNVYETMARIKHPLTKSEYDSSMCDEHIIIVSLLHDLGKMGHHNKPNYVVNMIQDKKNKGQFIQSSSKPFETNKELLYVPHEIESVAIANRFIELSEDEEFAILHHNGMYGDLKYQLTGKETSLQMLLHFADMWVSHVTEVEDENI